MNFDTQILGSIEPLLFSVFAVFLRVSAFMAFLPVVGERTIPARIKLVASVVVTMALLPAVSEIGVPQNMGLFVFSELITGAMFGILLRFLVMALQISGVIAAQATSLSQLLGGSAAEPLPALGHFLLIGGLALFAISGLHVEALLFIALTYQVVPMAQLPDPAIFSELGLGQVSKIFSLALSLAAPFVVVSVLYNVALGAINKAMPQLMVAFVGAPLITGASLVLLFVSAPLMISVWIDNFAAFIENPVGN